MPDLVRVLMVEDVADDAALVERELRRAGITGATRRVDSERGYREALQSFAPDIILTDHSLPTFGAADALRIALLEAPDTPVIVVTGSLDEETAAEYIKAGAADYVVKHHLERVGPAVVRALDLRRARTEQARAEEARRQGEERFRALIEHGADAVALVAPDQTLLFASHSIERLLGFAPAELVGHPGFERVHPDDLPQVHAVLRDVMASPGTPAGLELRWRHKDGSWRHIDAVAVDRLAEPAVGAIVVNFRDVTERRKAEAALRESEERYRTLVEGVRDIIFALSPEGTIASLNPAFETITGLRREEWVGQPFERLVHPEDLPLALELLGRVVRGELRPASQFRVRTAKGDSPAPRGSARRHPGHRARRHGARPARAAAAAGPENGSGRPAGGRHRPRLQQHPHGHHGLRGPPPRGPWRHRSPAPGRRRDSQGRRSRRRTHAPAAGVQSPAGPAAHRARGQQAGEQPGEDAAPPPRRGCGARHAARTNHGAGQGRSRPAR